MPWGYAAAAVVGLYSANEQSKSAEDAAKAQQESAEAGLTAEEKMFNQSLELQQPYREAGYDALSGLQSLSTDQGRADSLNNYYSSAEYGQLSNQANEDVIRGANVTGGTRSGSTNQAIASIAPQLGQNYLSNQYNNLTGLANMGIGAASQGAQAANNFGSSANFTNQQIGEAQAQNYLAQGNINSELAGTLGGLAGDYYRN